MRLLMLVCLSTAGLFAATNEASAQYARQYYGSWRYAANRGFHYRLYYYKPYASHNGYKHHYVIRYRSQPQYLYYFHPGTGKYWGRLSARGYSLLPQEARAGK